MDFGPLGVVKIGDGTWKCMGLFAVEYGLLFG
jgi:hypothetical protein